METNENGRKRFFPTVSLGSIVATLAVCGSAIGIYTNLYAEVKETSTKVRSMEAEQLKKEQTDRDTRQEIRTDIRDVKQDVKGLNDKLDKVIYELRRGR